MIYFGDGLVALGREREIKDINLVSEQKNRNCSQGTHHVYYGVLVGGFTKVKGHPSPGRLYIPSYTERVMRPCLLTYFPRIGHVLL